LEFELGLKLLNQLRKHLHFQLGEAVFMYVSLVGRQFVDDKLRVHDAVFDLRLAQLYDLQVFYFEGRESAPERVLLLLAQPFFVELLALYQLRDVVVDRKTVLELQQDQKILVEDAFEEDSQRDAALILQTLHQPRPKLLP